MGRKRKKNPSPVKEGDRRCIKTRSQANKSNARASHHQDTGVDQQGGSRSSATIAATRGSAPSSLPPR